MNKKSALAMMTFAGLSIVLGLVFQLILESIGMGSGLASRMAAYMCACPIALMAARRVGDFTRVALLTASLVVVCIEMAAIFYLLDAIAEPAGGHARWSAVLSAGTAGDILAALIVPQLWLWLFDKWGADHSSTPSPVSGS